MTPEQNAKAAKQLDMIASAASDLARLTRLNLKPTNRNLSWSEWRFAKVLHDYFGDTFTEDLLDIACHELGVDRDGELIEDDGTAYGDQRRDEMVTEWSAE